MNQPTDTPILIVLDLDHTVWNFYATDASDAMSPYHSIDNDTVSSADMQRFELFKGSREVIAYVLARPSQFVVRVASASVATQCAKELLSLFGLQPLCVGAQIYGGDKTKHLKMIGDQKSQLHTQEQRLL